MKSKESATIDATRSYRLKLYADLADITMRAAVQRARAGKIPGAHKPHGDQWRVPGTSLLVFVTPAAAVPFQGSVKKRSKAAAARARAAV